MAFDAARYRREVLDPARAAGNRPPEDLILRYQLREPLDGRAVAEAHKAVRAHWHKQRSSLAYRKVIDTLEADDRSLTAAFTAARNGDLLPLRAEISKRRDQQGRRLTDVRAELTQLAGALRMLAPGTVAGLAAQRGLTEDGLRPLLKELNIEVRERDELPTDPPLRGFTQLRQHLKALGCRHIADFLLGREALAGGFSVLDGFAVTGRAAVRLDRAAIARRSAQWARQLVGKSMPESVLATLNQVDEARLPDVLAYECMQALRDYRDLGADAAALQQHALGLGLVAPDARRLAFAVAGERVAHRSQVAEQLTELLAERRTVAAHELVRTLGDQLPADCAEAAAHATQLGGRALELLGQARAASDPDTGWRLLNQATSLATDLSDVEQLRLRMAPYPARAVVAEVDGGRVVVRWEPSRSQSGAIRYAVHRSSQPPPTGPGGRPGGQPQGGTVAGEPSDEPPQNGLPQGRAPVGDLVAETADTHAHDPAPPVNQPLHYTVTASRDGVTAAVVGIGAALWFRPEVQRLAFTEDDGVISGTWGTPRGVNRVLVRRAEDHPPRDVHDGRPVPAALNSFTDRRIQPGVTYHYLVAAAYVDGAGVETTTAGLRFAGRSVRPPQPVRELELVPAPNDPGWLVARFTAPDSGEVQLREFDTAPPHPAGTRLPATEVPGRPRAGVPVPGGLRCPAPSRAVLLAAVTVSGDRAVFGDCREWIPPTSAPVVTAQRRGHGVALSWEWPAGVVEMEVRWRADEQPWRTMRVSAARIIAEGGLHLPGEADGRIEIAVAALSRGVAGQHLGAARTVVVQTPVRARYTLRRHGFLRRSSVVATITADRPVRVPRLVVVCAGPNLPLRAADGVVLAELSDVQLDPAAPTVLRLPLPDRERPFWLRCFATGGEVELRDPPREQLRVR